MYKKFITVKIILILFLLLSSLPVYAFDKVYQMTIDDFEDFEIKSNGVKINNFSLSEENAWMVDGMKTIKISFSAKNKLEHPKHFTIMLVGMKDGEALWALNAEPMMATLSAKKTESINQTSYVIPGTLKQTKTIWFKVVGDI